MDLDAVTGEILTEAWEACLEVNKQSMVARTEDLDNQSEG
jgi:hypothetical protein